MARRQIPLFIIDNLREHKLGEYDFIVCTDIDNGFVAKVEFIEGELEEVGLNYRIGNPNGGVSTKISIERFLCEKPEPRQVSTLLKAAQKYYKKCTQIPVHVANPTIQECIDTLQLMVRANKHFLNEAKGRERDTVVNSLQILSTSVEYLKKLPQNTDE